MTTSEDTIALAIKGEIDLDTFWAAVDRLRRLAKSLASDLVPDSKVVWNLADLEYGSAVVSLRPVSATTVPTRRLILAYRDIGEAIAADRPLRYSESVRSAAQSLTEVCDRRGVEAVQFVSHGRKTRVKKLRDHTASKVKPFVSIGEVTGVVESVSRREELSLSLVDDVYKSRVTVHLTQEQAGLARQVWDKHVTVTGAITESPGTGRPTDVRRITSIEPVRTYEPDAWRAARGVFPWKPGDPPAEEQIREIRGRA